MLCQNCGKNEVNFRYTQIINGVKKEMALCDKCAKSLGLESLDFNMPINFSNFLGDFLNVAADANILPSFTKTGVLQCNECGMTYNEFVDTGKFGCSHCYDIFANVLDPVLKNIHGSSNHVGRRSRLSAVDKKKVAQYVDHAHKKDTKTIKKDEKQEKIDNVLDNLKNKYGYNMVTRAGKLEVENIIKGKEKKMKD